MNIVFKIVSALVNLGAGFAANKIIDAIWTKTTGNQPPKDGDNLETSLRSVLVFAVVSASVSAVIQTLTGRGAQRAIAKYKKSRDLT